MQRILRELRRLPHKFTRLTPTSELLADLRWWDKFLSVYNGVWLLRSSPWIDNESRFSTDACLSGIGGFFDGRHDQRQVVVWGPAWPTGIGQNWQSKHWTCHQYWSLSRSIRSVVFAWALVLRFSLRLWAPRLIHTRPREHYRRFFESLGYWSSFSCHLSWRSFSLLRSLVRVRLFFRFVSLRVPVVTTSSFSFRFPSGRPTASRQQNPSVRFIGRH